MRERIGLFGGTFDPVHFGHLHLALTLYEAHGLDRVLFIPASKNPLKSAHPALDSDRLDMLKLALQNLPFFEIEPLELDRPPPSFTVDTVKQLKERYQERAELFLLFGEDALESFHLWKNPEELLSLAKPLVCAREEGRFPKLPHLSEELQEKLKAGYTKAPLIQISATMIRNRLKQRLFCGHLLPEKVLDFILSKGLYYSI